MTEAQSMDIGEILDQLPHRYPFLLVDRVKLCVPGERIEAVKNVTINEPFFLGHFPGQPVMPGVLIIEAMAQAAGLLAFATGGRMQGNDVTFYFVGIDKARFRRPVVPGDQLALNVTFARRIRDIWKFSAEASVEGEIAASADLMVAPKVGPS